jgi:hypothetical protein
MIIIRLLRQLRWLGPLAGALLGVVSIAWAENGPATLVQFTGSTLVRRAGSAEYRPAEPRMVLGPGDIVRTGPNSGAVLLLPDGTEMRLGPNSALALPAPRGSGKPEGLRLERGRIWVRPPPGHRPRFEDSRGMGPRRPDRESGRQPGAWRPPMETPGRVLGGGPIEGRPHRGRSLKEGDVIVRRSGTGAFEKIRDRMPLNSGDLIRTGPNALVVIHFADGSQIKLKENAALVVPVVARRIGPGPVAVAVVKAPIRKPVPASAAETPAAPAGKDSVGEPPVTCR